MARIDFLQKKIEGYLRKEQLLKKEEYIKLEKPFLRKARKNFTVANLMFKISEQDDFKKTLALSQDFETYEWVIVVSYYSMYVSALAALARLGLKSKSHAATIVVLEHYYVHQQKNSFVLFSGMVFPVGHIPLFSIAVLFVNIVQFSFVKSLFLPCD